MSEIKTGPVGFDEINAIIGDGEIPNAGKMRALLGDRGSNTTIQKHLDAIRAARAPAAAPAATVAQVAPAEALAALWTAATTAVTASVYTRMESVTAERDTLKEQAQQLAQDLTAALEDSDTARAETDAARTAAAAAAAAADATTAEITRITAAAETAAAAATAEITRISTAAETAAALAARDTALATKELQAALERQIEKYTELRGMLERLTPPKQ